MCSLQKRSLCWLFKVLVLDRRNSYSMPCVSYVPHSYLQTMLQTFSLTTARTLFQRDGEGTSYIQTVEKVARADLSIGCVHSALSRHRNEWCGLQETSDSLSTGFSWYFATGKFNEYLVVGYYYDSLEYREIHSPQNTRLRN